MMPLRARLFRNLFVDLVVGVFSGSAACFYWLTGNFYLKISVLSCLLPFSRFRARGERKLIKAFMLKCERLLLCPLHIQRYERTK